ITNPNTGAYTYTPAANYNGSDSFTFKASDGSLFSNVATVSITVNPVDDAPAADPKSVITAEDTAATIMLSGSDGDSTSLTFIIVSGPAHGTLSVISGTTNTAVPNGTGTPGVSSTASITYTPFANYYGPDSFTYTVNDGSLNSAAATVS